MRGGFFHSLEIHRNLEPCGPRKGKPPACPPSSSLVPVWLLWRSAPPESWGAANWRAETSPANDSNRQSGDFDDPKKHKSRYVVIDFPLSTIYPAYLGPPLPHCFANELQWPPNSPGRTRRCRSALLSGSTSTHPQSLRDHPQVAGGMETYHLTDVLKQQQNAEKKNSFPTFRGTHGIYGTWITFSGVTVLEVPVAWALGSPIILQIKTITCRAELLPWELRLEWLHSHHPSCRYTCTGLRCEGKRWWFNNLTMMSWWFHRIYDTTKQLVGYVGPSESEGGGFTSQK